MDFLCINQVPTLFFVLKSFSLLIYSTYSLTGLRILFSESAGTHLLKGQDLD
jgi:hypothetical protein